MCGEGRSISYGAIIVVSGAVSRHVRGDEVVVRQRNRVQEISLIFLQDVRIVVVIVVVIGIVIVIRRMIVQQLHMV